MRGDLTDDFLAATPIHPTFKVPEVFGQESEQLKFEAYTNFTGTFTPFAGRIYISVVRPNVSTNSKLEQHFQI